MSGETETATPPQDAGGPAFPVVGIGASAGGLEALALLVKRLAPSGMSYVVLQHLAPKHDSMLAEILARDTTLPVVTLHDGVALSPDVIHVVPPNADATFDRGAIRLRPPSTVIPRHSIDTLFRSLAGHGGPSTIGIVLSGAGSDGTVGLRAIRAAGGLTFAQSPASANQPSMPQSAVDAGAADFCLGPAEIGDELMRLGALPFVARPIVAPLFAPAQLEDICQILQATHGVDFSAYKRGTLERRIARRMAMHKLERADAYVAHLHAHPHEIDLLYSDVLIGVTTFFRDPEAFARLAETVFPRLLDQRPEGRAIRIWVAGCATGEEAYSLAICLLEVLGERVSRYPINIFATDIDDEALTTARLGVYGEGIAREVSEERLERFFTRSERGYQVVNRVRELVVFARHDLGKDPPFSRLDLVTCRNVLIYLQTPLQRRLLRVIHYALAPDAFLVLGGSETVGDAADFFALVDQRSRIYQKKNAPSAGVFDFAFGRRREAVPAPRPVDHRPMVTVQQLADRKVIDRYAPPGLLVDEHLDVIQFRGQTGPFLAPTPGTATFHVFKLARSELLVELRATIDAAIAKDGPASSAPIPSWDPEHGPITLDVIPVHDVRAQRGCLLVSFRHELGASPPVPPPSREPRSVDLEHELTTTKDYLQSVVAELATTNEELQSANEELQSANEELQSTNEELETSKEELQSTNEELATVNDELQTRMSQLATSEYDLRNVLAHVSSAVVLIDHRLCIRRFTASAETILNLMPTDVGRPSSYLDNVLAPMKVEEVLAGVLRTGAPQEHRVRTAAGAWYTMRTSRATAAEPGIVGALLELTRVLPGAASSASEVPELEGRVLSALPWPLVLLDAQSRIVYANTRCFARFQLGAEILGIPLDQAWPASPGQDAFWTALQALGAAGAPFQDVRVAHPFGRPDLGELRCDGYRIPAEGTRGPMSLLLLMEGG